MQHADLVERFIASAYPRAEIAIVAGSTARGERTASSERQRAGVATVVMTRS
ncbi:hypothetical protein [Microbacterium sp. NPDC091662]|uniref:hypothetical protein n=1 Tax=Microbacterium sp. NPDC091662 TaxID=3364211 RepID=UPI00381EF5E4